MDPAQPLLAARGIRKSFGGVEVLHGVDLHLHRGEVLALLGENGAGKSTLVKVLAGDHQPDAGTLHLDGQELGRLDPLRARRAGIRMIFQELSDAPALSVAENISLGGWPARAGLVSWRSLRRRARDVLARLGVDLDVDAPVGSLRVGERQIVEIARALADDARVLILDEPTAALSSAETDRLFAAVRQLRGQGVAMVYITHRLDEVAAIADRVQVLRDGATALDRPTAEAGRALLVSSMIGREAAAVARPGGSAVRGDEPPRLRLDGVACGGVVADVDLDVRSGEVVALYGKLGSGTAEVAETVFGLRAADAGTVVLPGGAAAPRGPRAAIGADVGYLPPDRQREGAFLTRSVGENLAAPSWARMARRGVLRRAPEAAAFERWRTALSIRSSGDAGQQFVTLSGGNQQKVLLARWFERGARLLVLVEPTRGVDVGARADIYATIRRAAERDGTAVLVVTSDYEEVVQLADRALVMARGRVVAEFDGDSITTSALTVAAGG